MRVYEKSRKSKINVLLVIMVGTLIFAIIVLTNLMVKMSDEMTVLVMRVHDLSEENLDDIKGFENRIYILECEIENLKAQNELAQSLEPPKEPEEVVLVNEIEEEDSNGFTPMAELPISDGLQEFTYDISVEYNIPFEALIAVMDQESNFNENLRHTNTDGTTDVGIMQINSVNWRWLENQYGLDVNDVNDNIEAGAVILSDLWEKYSPEEALSAYNLGEGGFRKHGVNAYGSTVYALYLDYESELAITR